MLEREEAIEILEEIAREGPDHARVVAIRFLLKLHKEEDEEDPRTPFDDLYDLEDHRGDELAAKRKKRPVGPPEAGA
jgi:hypothetical protein